VHARARVGVRLCVWCVCKSKSVCARARMHECVCVYRFGSELSVMAIFEFSNSTSTRGAATRQPCIYTCTHVYIAYTIRTYLKSVIARPPAGPLPSALNIYINIYVFIYINIHVSITYTIHIYLIARPQAGMPCISHLCVHIYI